MPRLHHLVLPLCLLLEVCSNHKTLKGNAGARVSSTAFRLGSLPLSVSHLAQRSPVARSLQCLVARLPGCLGRQVAAAQQVGRRQVPRRIIANHLSNKWTKSRYATTNESRVELRWVRALTATAVQWAEVDIFWSEPIQVWISWLWEDVGRVVSCTYIQLYCSFIRCLRNPKWCTGD